MFSRMFTNSKNGQVPPSVSPKFRLTAKSRLTPCRLHMNTPQEVSRIPPTSSTSRTPDHGGLRIASTSVDRPSISGADSTAKSNSLQPPEKSRSYITDASREMLGGLSDNPHILSVPSTLPLATRSRSRPTTIPGRGSSISAAASSPAAVEEQQLDPAQIKSLSNGTVRSDTISRHVREGALSQVDSEDHGDYVTAAAPDSLIAGPAPDIDSSPERFRQWRQTMEGLLDGQGIEEDLHRELGLSAASLSISAKGDKGPPKVFPADLGRGQSLRRTATEGSKKKSNLTTASSDTGVPEEEPKTSRLESSLQVPTDSIPLNRPLSPNAPGMPASEEFKASRLSSRASLDIGSPSVDTAELELQGKTLAAEMFDGDETHVKTEQIAEYIGGR